MGLVKYDSTNKGYYIMKTYSVIVSETQVFFTSVEVEANSEEEAIKKAADGKPVCDEFSHCLGDYDVMNIEEIEE